MKEVKIIVPEGMELVQEGNTYKLVEKEFKLKVGGDYKRKNATGDTVLALDRNRYGEATGFYGEVFYRNILCNDSEWEEATEEEVKEAFEKECVRRFGEDWESIKLNLMLFYPLLGLGTANMQGVSVDTFNTGSFKETVYKDVKYGWMVLNRNGVLYYNGEWNEPLKKELPKTFEELGKIKGFYVDNDSLVRGCGGKTYEMNRNTFPTKEQAEASLALAQLSQLREVYRDGWEPDWTNNKNKEVKYGIDFCENRIIKCEMGIFAKFLSFQSEEVRDKFLENFKDLIEKARPLLG